MKVSRKPLVALATTLALTLLLASALLLARAQPIPRGEMVILGGAWWEPPRKWNPFNYGGSASGTVGLIYEPLYLWTPIKPEAEAWTPWLARELPTWESPTRVVIKLRPEAKWWDGKPITADDIIFTFYEVPRKLPWCAWCGMKDYIIEIQKVDDKTVRFIFGDNANYANFLQNLYSAPVLPKHVLSSFVDQYGGDLVDLAKWPVVAEGKDPAKIVASGMYRIHSLADDHFILVRVDNWWGKDVFGLPAPRYVKGVVVYSNQVAANMLGAGELDWSNFYIPGGPDMVKRGLAVAYFKDYPFYLPANVAYLFVNTQKAPFNDPNFRKAMYFAIDVDKIISAAFEGVVTPANPVGLMPHWEKYLAKDLIDQYGYKYDPERAKRILDAAGYRDINGDGCRELPDGKPFRMTIIVPYGWTDWMFAIINIADDLKKVGICAEAQFPDFGLYVSMIDKGEYDAAINNFGSFATPHPYTLYYWAFRSEPGIWIGNHGRYNNPQLNALIDQLGSIPPLPEYEDRIKSTLREIQKILLEEMPALPLWYNGFWFLASTKYWTGWPSQDNPYGVPVDWNGQWQYGGMTVLLKLKPAAAPTAPAPPAAPTPAPAAGYDVLTIVAAIVIVAAVAAAAFFYMKRAKKKKEG
ncbi:MAG: ABC transporter substrate-binding protein [Thermofilum sp.]|uniref:ABC transporter substrate-binding protein n=1 Tax=Thermofilum pendens TaxID=2269 RepID=A0A7C4D1T4_THEPE